MTEGKTTREDLEKMLEGFVLSQSGGVSKRLDTIIDALSKLAEAHGVDLSQDKELQELRSTQLIEYTNYKGERSVRQIIPKYMYLGSTKWHPERQWLLKAQCLDRKAERDFAVKDILQWQAVTGEVAVLVKSGFSGEENGK